MPGSAAGSIARIASTTIAVRHRRTQQPFHGLLDAIIGGDSVDDEERVVLVVASDELVRVGSAEQVVLVFLQGEMRRQLAAQARSDRQNHGVRTGGRRQFAAGPACRPCSAVGTAGARDRQVRCEQAVARIGIAVASRELRQPCEVGNDLARSRHVECTIRVHEVALGVDVEEDQGAFEHGRVPRFASANSWFPLLSCVCHNSRSARPAPHGHEEMRV